MSELFDRYYEALRRPRAPGGEVRISGSGRLAGGRYGRVVISGSGRVESDLEAEELKCAGSASFHGSVTTVEASLAGSAKIEGDLKAEHLKAAGSLSVAGRLEADEMRVAGALRASSVKGKLVKLAGAFSVREGIEGEIVELRLSDDSSAAFVKGVEVTVKAERRGFALLFLRGSSRPALRVGSIEADLLVVEDAVVEGVVKAKRIELKGQGEARGPIEGELVRR